MLNACNFFFLSKGGGAGLAKGKKIFFESLKGLKKGQAPWNDI